ncbi:Hypothetical protein POVN_LOCUS510 [uncultured virus]|nr:Hypothetical protein POVN_LOCUS510 [uncultured virus]
MEALQRLKQLVVEYESVLETKDAKVAQELRTKLNGLGNIQDALLEGLATIIADYKAPPIRAGTEACVAELLAGWTVGEFLGEGADARVYNLKRGCQGIPFPECEGVERPTFLIPPVGETKQEPRVLRVSISAETSEEDYKLHYGVPSELGIGPRFYGAVECPYTLDPLEYEQMRAELAIEENKAVAVYIVMQRLSGPLLAQVKFMPEYLVAILDLVYTLWQKTGLIYEDLHDDNIMFNQEPDGSTRLYLIDFSLLTPTTIEAAPAAMYRGAYELINSVSADREKSPYAGMSEKELVALRYKHQLTLDAYLSERFPGVQLATLPLYRNPAELYELLASYDLPPIEVEPAVLENLVDTKPYALIKQEGNVTDYKVQVDGHPRPFILRRIYSPPGAKPPLQGELFVAAGEMHVAPPVHKYVHLDGSDGSHLEYFMFSKPNAPSLDQRYPYDKADVQAALESYYALYTEGKILQNDPVASNFVVFAQMKYAWLTSFDKAVQAALTEDQWFDHMFNVAVTLVGSLTTRSDGPWSKAPRDEQLQVWLTAVKAATVWMLSKFKGRLKTFVLADSYTIQTMFKLTGDELTARLMQ